MSCVNVITCTASRSKAYFCLHGCPETSMSSMYCCPVINLSMFCHCSGFATCPGQTTYIVTNNCVQHITNQHFCVLCPLSCTLTLVIRLQLFLTCSKCIQATTRHGSLQSEASAAQRTSGSYVRALQLTPTACSPQNLWGPAPERSPWASMTPTDRAMCYLSQVWGHLCTHAWGSHPTLPHPTPTLPHPTPPQASLYNAYTASRSLFFPDVGLLHIFPLATDLHVEG